MTQATEETKRDGQGTIIQEGTLFRSPTPPEKPIIPDVSQSFTSIVQIALNVLINPDEAYRANRQQQEQMLHDPIVMGPLQKRLLATAKLEWEVAPEDPKDPAQVETAKQIKKIIERMPRWCEFVRYLGFAVLRGTSASEINWEYDRAALAWGISNHRPYHGDKITYDIYGNPRILTRQFQTGGRQLDQGELDRLIIHTHDRDDGDFYDGATAGYVYKGRGLRDVIWPYWYLKQNSLKLWVALLDKYSTGWVEGRYPLGNKQAKDAIEGVLRNMLAGSIFSVPVPPGMDKETYGVFPLKMEGTGESAKLFVDFVEDYCGKHIRILIEGQDQAHQSTGDGLGSGRAQELAEMFTLYRDYDAALIEDTLSEQLVNRVQFFNFGELPYKCHFQFILDRKDYEANCNRVKTAKEIGLTVKKKWVYDMLDVERPQGDESANELLDWSGQMQLPGQPAPGRIFATDAEGAGERLFSTDASSHAPSEYKSLFSGLLDDKPLFTGEAK
jgi:phage gp29-like protein